MILLSIALALLAERALARWRSAPDPARLAASAVRLQRRIPWAAWWSSPASAVLPPVLAMLAVHGLDRVVDGVVAELLLGVAILLLCLGPRDLSDEVRELLAAREAGDEAREQALTARLLAVPDRRHSRRSLLGALFLQSHERLFAVLFWYVMLGPVGAVLWRVASGQLRLIAHMAPGTAAARAAQLLHGALAWLPLRLTALLFALAGSTDSALRGWQRAAAAGGMDWVQRGWALLAETATGALMVESEDGGEVVSASLDDCLGEVLALQFRAKLLLLGALALFTIGGWLA